MFACFYRNSRLLRVIVALTKFIKIEITLIDRVSVMGIIYWYLLANVYLSYWIILLPRDCEKNPLCLIKNALHCKKHSKVSLLSHL